MDGHCEELRVPVQHYLNSPINPTITRSDVLIRIFFGRFTTKENIKQWLEGERDKSQAMYDNLSRIADMCGSEMEQHKRFTLEFGIFMIKNKKLLFLQPKS